MLFPEFVFVEEFPILDAYMSKTERDLFHTQVINSNLPTTFSRKMYFWPISHDQLRRNLRLTQNPGWTYYD